jgi:hypothetical protein
VFAPLPPIGFVGDFRALISQRRIDNRVPIFFVTYPHTIVANPWHLRRSPRMCEGCSRALSECDPACVRGQTRSPGVVSVVQMRPPSTRCSILDAGEEAFAAITRFPADQGLKGASLTAIGAFERAMVSARRLDSHARALRGPQRHRRHRDRRGCQIQPPPPCCSGGCTMAPPARVICLKGASAPFGGDNRGGGRSLEAARTCGTRLRLLICNHPPPPVGGWLSEMQLKECYDFRRLHLLRSGGCGRLVSCGIARGNADLVPVMMSFILAEDFAMIALERYPGN